jgi:hypothetical protein
MWRKSFSIISIILCSVVAIGSTVYAESSDAQATALSLITKTADGICNTVRDAGSSQSVKVKGDVKAQLNGLIKQLADLGISGAADFAADQYEGLLHADLATAMAKNAECKFNVFNKLQERMIK